ncbi:MAG: hypothetical protein RLZZ610_54 [Actinomycetota bacterium]|jgi:hypothetical protein
MPKYEINKETLEVRLNPLEKLASLRWGVSVPLKAIKGATVDRGAVPHQLGLRIPGTGFPGLIAAGTFIKNFDKQFVFWAVGESVVVVELEGHKFQRLILGTKNAEQLEQRINQAIRN